MLLGHGPFTAAADPPASGVAFHVRDFSLRSMLPWKIPTRWERLDQREFTVRFNDPSPLACRWQIPDAAPFSEVFQEVMTEIRGGFFEKTVPVVTETGEADAPPASAIAAAMAACRQPLLSYGWVESQRGFAGATPELLFSLRNHRLDTMALAGTARSEDRDVFAVDDKEIREHEYVAQSLVAKLLELGSLHRHPREILDLGPIIHFLTHIQVDLEAVTPIDTLIRRLHPTPALGPLPRTDATMARLLAWRSRLGCPEEFGAPFGIWKDGCFHAVIAIRGVWWDNRQLRIPAGCGVIEASRLVNEWRELRLKREAVKSILASHSIKSAIR